MPIINLRVLYPDLYIEDTQLFIESEVLAEKILNVFKAFSKENHAYRERARIYKAYFSYEQELTESEIRNHIPSPEEIFDEIELNKAIYSALNQLSSIQLRRVYLYYFLGYSKSKIARLEGVDKSSIRRSIERALTQIKKKINEFL
jgi:RNA polymerase sigma-70 factor (ECF subfamily)